VNEATLMVVRRYCVVLDMLVVTLLELLRQHCSVVIRVVKMVWKVGEDERKFISAIFFLIFNVYYASVAFRTEAER